MNNKYVRGLVVVLIGLIALLVLLFIGDLIAGVQSAEAARLAWTPGDSGIPGWWLTWVIVGAVLLYLVYIFFSETNMFNVSTRQVVMMAIGAALYGVLSWLFNIIPVPSVSLVALRPMVVIPIFFRAPGAGGRRR